MNELSREEKAAAAKSRMAELAAKFLDRTRGDIATMREGLSRLSAGQVGALGDIRHLAHRMVGTGATLGFDSISECAHVIERLTESCAPGVKPDADLRAEIGTALDALEAAFRSLRSN